MTIIARLTAMIVCNLCKVPSNSYTSDVLRASEMNHHPQRDVNAYENMFVLDNIMLSQSSIKFVDVPLFIIYVVVCIQTSRLRCLIQKHQVSLSCCDVSSVGVHSPLLHGT